MRRAFLQALLIFLLLLLPAGALWWKAQPERRSPDGGEGKDPAVTESRAHPAPPPTLESPAAATGEPSLEPEWAQALAEARTRKRSQAGLEAIAGELQALPRAQAVARIQRYLASGQDVRTGLPWALGAEGRLTTAPTLRVWLLDWLGRIDPAAAAALAKVVFAEGPGGSADEWALHLRNQAWGDPGATAFLIGQAVAMLEHEPWRAEPSAGFQEAFDVFVWAGAVEESPRLARLLPAELDQRLRQPANLALDRLVLQDPAGTLQRLGEDLRTLDSQPYTRAGYFARADLDDPGQRALVEAYFLDPRLSGAERDYFLQLVPNLNLNFSHNLLSANPAPARDDVVEKLRQAEAMMAAWLADPRFRPWRANLEEALARVRSSR